MSSFPSYPVETLLPDLLSRLSASSVVLLSSPPGSGKTTLLPLLLRKAGVPGNKKIILLQPRRIAAKSVAQRMTDILGEPLGKTVGYRIRHESLVSPTTQIEVMTEGILTRMMQANPELEGIGLILFDEFHERSLQSDTALVIARQIQESLRDDLRLLVMSATLTSGIMEKSFPGVPYLRGSGRSFPVEVIHIPEEREQRLGTRVLSGLRRALRETTGDILVFVPGVSEIRFLSERIEAFLQDPQDDLFPASSLRSVSLYGDLPFDKQQSALLPDPSGKRKIILSTPIAETSLTIEGVECVIDSGFEKVLRYLPGRGGDTLELQRISQDSAEQRAGRAGRLGPGKCYRLYQGELMRSREPEILRADLSSLVLEVSAWAGKDWQGLSWIDQPPIGAVRHSQDLLRKLDFLDDELRVTEQGRRALGIPCHPRLASMLLKSAEMGSLQTACDLAALIEEKDFLDSSDPSIETRLEALSAFRRSQRLGTGISKSGVDRCLRISNQFFKLFSKGTAESVSRELSAGYLLSFAYPERLAKRRNFTPQDSRYLLAAGLGVKLRSEYSLAKEAYLIVADFLLKGAEGEVRLAAAIAEHEVYQRYESLIEKRREVEWDGERESVRAEEILQLDSLILERRPIFTVSEEEKCELFTSALRQKSNLTFLPWGEEAVRLRQRMKLFESVFSEGEEIPLVSDEALRSSLDDWLFPYLGPRRKFSELENLDFRQLLLNRYPWTLRQQLEDYCPDKAILPGGKERRYEFPEEGGVILAATVQELFGWKQSPLYAKGRIPLMLHILSPARRPIQVTADLLSFWDNTYHTVRKELRGRYPKHPWPEDPKNAAPIIPRARL